MAQKSLGMTFLFGCTMTLSCGYDMRSLGVDRLTVICYNKTSIVEKSLLTQKGGSRYCEDLLFYKILKEDKMSKKWKLNIGCHRKTLMSRDTDVREHDSLEDCKRDVKELEESWARMGYYVWFANAVGPDGEKVELHKGTPYY